MKLKAISSSIFFLISGITITCAAYAQQPLTGSRLETGGGSTPRTVIQMHEPEEFAKIRRLLNRGDADEARELALFYVNKVEQSGMGPESRYYAYNALCVTYTYTGEMDQAEELCSKAIRTMPGHWSAYNNRGTARMLSGNYEGAAEDYSLAQDKAGNSGGTQDLLEHNIELLRQRQN